MKATYAMSVAYDWDKSNTSNSPIIAFPERKDIVACDAKKLAQAIAWDTLNNSLPEGIPLEVTKQCMTMTLKEANLTGSEE